MPLCLAPRGMAVEVKKLGAEEKIARHLHGLGIAVGARLTVISSEGGNVIVMVKEGRLCLDRHIAARITVAPAA